jgi:hypothetical protein
MWGGRGGPPPQSNNKLAAIRTNLAGWPFNPVHTTNHCYFQPPSGRIQSLRFLYELV